MKLVVQNIQDFVSKVSDIEIFLEKIKIGIFCVTEHCLWDHETTYRVVLGGLEAVLFVGKLEKEVDL